MNKSVDIVNMICYIYLQSTIRVKIQLCTNEMTRPIYEKEIWSMIYSHMTLHVDALTSDGSRDDLHNITPTLGDKFIDILGIDGEF